MSGDEILAQFDYGHGVAGKEAHWNRDQNLRDVIIHLYEWHALLLRWVTANQGGHEQPFLPEPYSWKTYADMNVAFLHKHAHTTYEEAARSLSGSHRRVMELIQGFSDEELFTKKHFTWTGTTTLGSYCVSATSSHYEWAMKKVRAHLKTLRTSASG